jgi:hypothetical protein
MAKTTQCFTALPESPACVTLNNGIQSRYDLSITLSGNNWYPVIGRPRQADAMATLLY